MSKASKQRPCPALGHGISAATCGEQRESRLRCPADCAYNPFNPANYSQLLEIEARLDALTLQRFQAQGEVRAPAQFTQSQNREQGMIALHAYFSWTFFVARDNDGATFAERWLNSPGPGLKNDERVLLRAKMQVRIALLEVHRLLPGDFVEAVDLLSPNPQPLILLDRSLSAVACRFSTFLAWIFPSPHYWRLSGSVLNLLEVAQLPPAEIVREFVRHLGGPTTEAEMRLWLAENMPRFHAAQGAAALLRRQQMFAGVDAKIGKAVYELQAPFAQCRDRLLERKDIAPDDLSNQEHNEAFVLAYVWFDSRAEAWTPVSPEGQTVLGRVILGQTLWRLEALGGEKLARLRQQFEEHFGKRVRFSGERIDDFAAQMAAKEPSGDRSLVPPRLLENPIQLRVDQSRLPTLAPGLSLDAAARHFRLAAEKAFLDDHVPALDGKTPREAAQDLLLRPKLIQLVKQRVRGQDENNLQTGSTDDLNWMLRELGLNEIIFEPPPCRSPPPSDPAGEDDMFDAGDFPEPPPIDPNRLPPPPLPATPLGASEAEDRLKETLRLFETFAAAQEELDASGSPLLDDIDELAGDILSDRDYTFGLPFFVQAWFVLVPVGCRAPEIDFDGFRAAYESNFRNFLKFARSERADKLELFIKNSNQVEFLQVLFGGVLGMAGKMPKDMKPSAEGLQVILSLLKALVEKLTETLRSPV